MNKTVLNKVRIKLQEKGVNLVAVSKTHPVEEIIAAYQEGQRVFGENKVQELASKYEQLPTDIEWHMIGHLQTNKVKYIAPFVSLIHGVDRLKLLREINKQAVKKERVIDCLLQIHIAEEETKFGFSEQELLQLLQSLPEQQLNNIRIRGLMGMATFTSDMQQVRNEFSNLKQLFDRIKQQYFEDNDSFSELSMGMSGDYETAIEEGSTMVSIGSLIFGERG